MAGSGGGPVIEKVLREFGIKLVQDVQENLKKKQQEKASKHGTPYNPNSNLVNSIKFFIRQSDSGIVFELRMADYFDYVDRGRRAGNVSEKGSDSIKRWIKVKGLNPVKIITDMQAEYKKKNPPKTSRVWTKKKVKLTFAKAQKQLAFLVSRKVKYFGYEGNHFYTEIILDGRLEQLEKDITEAIGDDLQIVVKDFIELK